MGFSGCKVAVVGGSIADVSELIPFFLRISRYFCGVMYLIITLQPARDHAWIGKVLSLNPPAVFIALIRVGFMHTVRTNSAGNQPYNAGLCHQFIALPGHHILPGTRVPTTLILPNSNLSSIVIPKTGDRTRLRENFGALEIRLSEAQLAELDRLFPPPTRATPLAML